MVLKKTDDRHLCHLISLSPPRSQNAFLPNDHSANDITLIPLELIKSNRDSVRKAREAYLIERGKTVESLGMNKKEEMYYSLYFFYFLSFIYTIFTFQISFQSLLQAGFCIQRSLFSHLNFHVLL